MRSLSSCPSSPPPVNARGAAPRARFDSAWLGTSCLLRRRRIHLRWSASRHLEPLGLSSVGASTCRGRSAGVHCSFKGWPCPHPPRCWRLCTRQLLPDAGSASPASGSARDCAPLLRVSDGGMPLRFGAAISRSLHGASALSHGVVLGLLAGPYPPSSPRFGLGARVGSGLRAGCTALRRRGEGFSLPLSRL